MALALSADLRRRVVAAVDDGMSCRAAAARFGIAPSTAIKWRQQWRRTGTIEPQRRGGDERSHRLEAHAAEILSLIDEAPDITLAEIVAQLERQHGLTLAPSTVWRLRDRHGLSFNKNGARRRAGAAWRLAAAAGLVRGSARAGARTPRLH
jgi:transposase